MIAMQYSINLPADYDMAIIRRRIADKGHLLDKLPGLVLKAYAYAARDDRELPARDNLYAPFYVWNDGDSMNAFLCGPGFAGLTRDFGRPVVRAWPVWQAGFAADATVAKSATREVVPLPVHVALGECWQIETAGVRAAMDDGALAAVVALDPASWTLIRFRLWPDLRAERPGDAGQSYRVGHVSQPRHPH